MNTSVNHKFFLRWRKCKAFFVRAMEVMARGQTSGFLNPYRDFPGDSFKSKGKLSENGKDSPSRAEELPKPEVRSNPRFVYETGVVGGTVDNKPVGEVEAVAKSAPAEQKLDGKKAKANRPHMDETEITIWIMAVIMLALTILAGVILEMKISR